MRILLLTHPMSFEEKLLGVYQTIPPLGITYIASSLEKDGHEVKILDCFAEGLHTKKWKDGSIRQGLLDEEILKRVSHNVYLKS